MLLLAVGASGNGFIGLRLRYKVSSKPVHASTPMALNEITSVPVTTCVEGPVYVDNVSPVSAVHVHVNVPGLVIETVVNVLSHTLAVSPTTWAVAVSPVAVQLGNVDLNALMISEVLRIYA